MTQIEAISAFGENLQTFRDKVIMIFNITLSTCRYYEYNMTDRWIVRATYHK